VGAVGAPAATGLLARRKPREMPYEPAGQFTPKLSLRFDSRATHVRTLLPASLTSVPFGFVLVRVRVRLPWEVPSAKEGARKKRERPLLADELPAVPAPPHSSTDSAWL
jgi:hypothetical protein